MHADEDVLRARDVALDERDVVLSRQHLLVRDRLEQPVLGRKADGDDALDELVVLSPVLDQVGDRDHLQPVTLAIADQIGHPRHRAVLVHDLADDSRRGDAGQPREVDGSLGLARALQHASGACLQREDVARLDEVEGVRGGVDRDLDRVGAVVCRDAGRDSLPCFDRDGEGRAERRLVLICHLAQPELRAALRREAQADEASPVGGHEVDGCGCDELGRDREVALVLAILVVDDDDEAAGADLLERFVDRGERRRPAHHGHTGDGSPAPLSAGRRAFPRISRARRLRD